MRGVFLIKCVTPLTWNVEMESDWSRFLMCINLQITSCAPASPESRANFFKKERGWSEYRRLRKYKKRENGGGDGAGGEKRVV